MTEKERDMFRYAMETQFRYKFYQNVQFPYLQSLGIDHVFQGFGNEDHGFIGMLHLQMGGTRGRDAVALWVNLGSCAQDRYPAGKGHEQGRGLHHPCVPDSHQRFRALSISGETFFRCRVYPGGTLAGQHS